jgi:hypothetical protein
MPRPIFAIQLKPSFEVLQDGLHQNYATLEAMLPVSVLTLAGLQSSQIHAGGRLQVGMTLSNRSRWCVFANCALAILLSGGCTATRPQAPAPAPRLALSLRGEDTRTDLDFDIHPAMTVPFDLADDEICYIPAGDGVIVCGDRGSYLQFGPEDGVILVKDTPFYHLRAAKVESSESAAIQMYSTVFMIAGTADRIPGALTEYLDDPGPHRRQAIALARALVASNGGVFTAAGRGGTFSVHIRLSELGRAKLVEAIQNDDVTRPGFFFVHFSRE